MAKRNRIAAALQASGAVVAASAVGMWSLPAGLLVAGLAALVAGVAMERE